MKSMKIQTLVAVLGGLASFYLLAKGIPSQLSHMEAQAGRKLASVETITTKSQDLNPVFPFYTKGIQIKASGEEPPPVTEDLEPYIATHEEFERRFGHSFKDAWKDQPVAPAPGHEFDIPKGLEGAVDFWVKVFGVYEKGYFVFHHRDDVSIVYSVLDLRKLSDPANGFIPEKIERLKNQHLKEEKLRVRNMLKGLADKMAKNAPLTVEENNLLQKFTNNGKITLTQATDLRTIRIQGGFAHRFKEAIVRSGKYIDEMENIFAMKGLPIELTRLPFVESTFNTFAYSSADAAGMWQFIPDTGARYLKIDDHADERYDPILATYAAATHLSKEFALLKSWPLTVNGYNTGPGRMLRAIRQLGTTDINLIIRNFKDPGYQFYSRNYYPEFLAAVHVYENRDKYFGPIETEKPLEYDFFVTRGSINLRELAESADMEFEALTEMNPALSKEILSGEKELPENYLVRVPKRMGPFFASVADRLVEREEEVMHVVKEGETLNSLSKLYNLSVEAITNFNGQLSPDTLLLPGTAVRIPQDTGVALNPPSTSAM